MNNYTSSLATGLIALLTAFFASSAMAASSREHLVSPPLPNFVVGYSLDKYAKSVRTEIPRDETMDSWTKMVTTQKFKGLAERIRPGEYAKTMLQDLPKACPGATASPVQSTKLAGLDSVRFKAVCPSGASGQPESFVLIAIAGKRDMYVKQVAFRGDASPEDFLWARKFLDGVLLCDKGSKLPACR